MSRAKTRIDCGEFDITLDVAWVDTGDDKRVLICEGFDISTSSVVGKLREVFNTRGVDYFDIGGVRL